MNNAAIYCRVSTDNQEREGTSLQTQLENCVIYCQSKGYEISYRFSEAYSGLSLERPELDNLRELVRTEAVDIIVCYSLDRLTRDPGHGVIITQELEKHRVILEAVTEDIDNSELGKLISYIRGYASKLEAEKIKERTGRGKRARAREGRMSGGFHSTYGYDYIPVSQKDGGRRAINDSEATWVRQIYQWLVNDGLTLGVIRNNLMAQNVPTKKGKFWTKVAIHSILKNPAYTGKTYAFTCDMKRKPRRKPKEEWIEIPDVTPAIISETMFEAAQKQLQVNREKAPRNAHRQYLLRGRIDSDHGRLAENDTLPLQVHKYVRGSQVDAQLRHQVKHRRFPSLGFRLERALPRPGFSVFQSYPHIRVRYDRLRLSLSRRRPQEPRTPALLRLAGRLP